MDVISIRDILYWSLGTAVAVSGVIYIRVLGNKAKQKDGVFRGKKSSEKPGQSFKHQDRNELNRDEAKNVIEVLEKIVDIKKNIK